MTGIKKAKKLLLFVNRILRPFNVKIKKGSSVTRSWPEALQHIKLAGFYPEVIVDVGVLYGTYELYESFPDSRYILFEALDTYEPFLKEIAGKFNATYHLTAAGSKAGSMPFAVRVDDPGASSAAIIEDEEKVDYVSVPVARIDEIVSEDDLGAAAALKVDVEGFELDVIEGCTRIIHKFEFVILECRFFKYQSGMYEFCEVVARMKELGFVVYDILDGGYRPQDNVLDLVDLLFVREDGFLRSKISRRYDHAYSPIKLDELPELS